MNLKPFYVITYVLFLSIAVSAQDKLNTKFGKISIQDFSPKSPAIDSSSNAVVLVDAGSTDFEGNSSGYFSIIFKQYERILLKSRIAFDEATVKVSLYNGISTYAERFEDFEATTYNLENGQIKETKLNKSAIFKEKYNSDYVALKFTLPDIKEGCIIEYRYTIKSPFYNTNIRSWRFQREYPVLWSEYKVAIPPIFNYSSILQGVIPLTKDSSWRVFKEYSIIDAGDATSQSTVYRLSGDARCAWWALKDVPAFKDEMYLSSSKNYISGIKFQLVSIKYSDTHIVQVLKSWITTANDLLKDPDFGESLSETNSWLDDDLKKAVSGSKGLEKALKIFAYVRDNFTCTDDDARYLSSPLKKTFQNKKGNVVDINMLLTAMLIRAGFDAHPVLLSTRDNGKVIESEAVLNQYNYVISRLTVDSLHYLLDASISRLGFGKLDKRCYNGSGRLIDKMPYLIPLSADSLKEEKQTLIIISNDEKNDIAGSYTTVLGYFESLAMRDKLAKSKQEDVLAEISKGYPSEFTVANGAIDSVKSYDLPVTVRHEFKVKFEDDIVYFNPMMNDAWKNNPFTSASRLYPVEMPYKMDELFTLNMEIPKGYKVDEIPKSARVKLNDNQGMFEYLIVNAGDMIQFRVRLVLHKATFDPEDYQTLRDFFGYVVKKEAEQIVFKKIK